MQPGKYLATDKTPNVPTTSLVEIMIIESHGGNIKFRLSNEGTDRWMEEADFHNKFQIKKMLEEQQRTLLFD